MSNNKSLAKIDDPIIKNLIEAYDDKFIESIELDEETTKKLIKYASKIRYGSYTFVPQICTAHECCYNMVCPLIKTPPLGHYCPFEKLMAESLKNQYYKALNVNPDDITETSQIGEIVESDIVNARTNALLGKESFIMENTVGISPDTGEEITRKEEHIAMRVKQRSQERRDKIFRNFIATRKDKMNVLDKMAEDPTEYMARLRSKSEKIKKAIQNMDPSNIEGKEVVEAEYKKDVPEILDKNKDDKEKIKKTKPVPEEEAPW